MQRFNVTFLPLASGPTPTPTEFQFSEPPVVRKTPLNPALATTLSFMAFAFRTAKTPDALQFTPQFDMRARPRIQVPQEGFVTRPFAQVFGAFAQDLLLRRRQQSIEIPAGFVRPPPVQTQTAFGESPISLRRRSPRIDTEFSVYQPIVVVTTFSGFGEFPDLIVRPRVALLDSPGLPTPPAVTAFVGAFGYSPAIRRRPVIRGGNFFVPGQPAVTSFVQAFGYSPAIRRRPILKGGQFSVPPTPPTAAAATPSFWGQFSESPTRTSAPKALQQFADISFLQIAYTPGPLVFSESPYALQKAKAVEQQPWWFAPIAVPTPSNLGMFSESPWWFKRPFQLNAWADIAFLQIAYNPQIWGAFSESPYQLKKPRPEVMPWVGMPTLPIRLIPLVFSESPWRIRPPFQLKQFGDISFLQIAYTPSSFGFSESQWTFRRPFQLKQFSDISFLQIAYTPSAFPFAEHPITNRNVRGWKPSLDQPSLEPVIPPTAAQTPSAFGFSESPTHITSRWIGAVRMELGNWGWILPPPVVTANVFEWHIRYRRRGRR